MRDANLLRGYSLAFVATALWSTTAILISLLTTRFEMPPLVLAFWRDLLVACTLFAALFAFGREQLRLERKHIVFFVFYGLLFALFNSIWTVSVALNGAAVATMLLYISPALTALIEWRLGDGKLGTLKIMAIGLSIVGLLFASGVHDPSVWQLKPLGIVAGLGTGLAFAIYSLLGKASSARRVKPWTATLYTFALGSAFLLLVQSPDTLLWLSRPLGEGSAGWREAALGWSVIIALAIGPTLGGFGLYTVSLTVLPASTANLIVTLEPAITAVLAYVLLGERLTAMQIVGGAIILIGVFILRLGDRRILARDLQTN
ncbi:MAG: DMT family transporter [Anaerolineae bacterium]